MFVVFLHDDQFSFAQSQLPLLLLSDHFGDRAIVLSNLKFCSGPH